MRRLFILVLAGLLLCPAAVLAQANWTAYNDCILGSTESAFANDSGLRGNPAVGTGSASGTLKNFATGLNTNVSATLSWSSVSWDATRGTGSNAGTDAQLAFNGTTTVGLAGMGAYQTTGTPTNAQVTFTGLNPNKVYEFVTTANRAGGSTYLDRYTKFMISDADAFTNASSSGVTLGDSGASTTFVTGENTATGYVARWTGIRSGADGDFTVWSGDATVGSIKPYVMQSFKLVETPEPATLSLLALGGMALLRRRR